MKTIERRRSFVMMLLTAFMFSALAIACNNDDDPKPLAAPVLSNADQFTTSSFRVNWTAVAGADKYLLDVSVNSNFSTTVATYNKKEVTGTNTIVNGLSPNTKYYYRLYAKKGANVSAASTVKDATTAQ